MQDPTTARGGSRNLWIGLIMFKDNLLDMFS